jgi:PKD repeat protein
LRGQRGQSEVIGIVLFTAVVVGAVVLVGALVIPTFAEDADRRFLSVDGDATTQNITLQHADGDSFSTDDLEIILRGNASSERYDFDGFTQLRGTDNATFEQGDRWYRSHGIDSEQMEILVVDVSQNQILDRTDVEVTETLGARFETNRTNPRTVDTIEFDGSGSVAPDGEITNYEWDLGDGTSKSTDSVTHSYDSSGTYDVTLTVETSDGRTASRTKSIQVFEPTPGAAFSFEPQDPDKGEQIEFNASASSSPGTVIDTYAWDFGDGTVNTTSSETITHSYSAYDSYNVSLTVTDGNNRKSTTGDLVSVIDTSKPILNKGNTIVFNDGGVKAIAGNGSNVSLIGVSGSPKALGPPEADLTGNGSVDLPYIKGSSLKIIDSAGNIKTLVGGGNSKPSNQNSLLAVGQWNGNKTSVFYIGKDKSEDTIYRVNNGGSVTVVARPGNGADAVMGTGDIDGDDTAELLFVDGSQQVRYLEPNGNIGKLTGGDVGSSSGLGAGQPSDFDNDGTVRAVIVDGSANVKIVGGAEPDITFTSTNAKKAPVTTADVDGDSDLEIVYVGSNGNLRYVDDPLGSPTTEFLTDDDGNRISASNKVGVVS